MSVGNALIEHWRPSPRPDWVQRVNEEGQELNLAAVVPLDAEYLIAAASKSCGLSDFGSSDWREPFDILTRALREESDLNLMGRILTSTELLAMLQARLRIEEQYRRHPEIANEVIVRPTFVLGQPRTGTSALQNLMSADPENRSFYTWEAWFPTPLDENDPQDQEKRIEKTERLSTMWTRVVPELATQHEINARVPTECNVIHSLAFRSKTMLHLGQIPSYASYMATASMAPAFEYHKRVLKYLQWRKPKCRWVLKSPDYIMLVREILEHYPDAQLIYTHRDPVKAFGSAVSLIGTLHWMRCDHPYKYDNPNSHATGLRFLATLLDNIIDGLESGAIPRSQFFDVRYGDFIRDPVQTVADIYAFFGRTLGEASRTAMTRYVKDNAASRSNHRHEYATASADEIREARSIFERYQEYFRIRSEV
jgi:hypothetical protein